MPPTEDRSPIPSHPVAWRPMSTAPETVARVWLNHLTLGPILAEGRRGRWYAPNAARQVWRWYRPAEPDGLEPFSGWLPFEASEEALLEEVLSAEAPAGDGGRGLHRPRAEAAPARIERVSAPAP